MAISRNPDRLNGHYSEQTGHSEKGHFIRNQRDYRRAFGLDSTIYRGFSYDPAELDRFSMQARQSSPQVQRDMVARVLKYRQNKPRG